MALVRDGLSYFKKKPIEALDVNLATYVNSKFVYVERHIRNQLEKLYRDVVKHRCELSRTVMAQQLSMAITAPEEFAYSFNSSPERRGCVPRRLSTGVCLIED